MCGLSYDEVQRSRSEVRCARFVLWMRSREVELEVCVVPGLSYG